MGTVTGDCTCIAAFVLQLRILLAVDGRGDPYNWDSFGRVLLVRKTVVGGACGARDT